MNWSFDENWAFVQSGSPMGFLFSLLFGAALGSFANVIIWRLPRGESIVRPASHCPQCGEAIPIRHNIPLLSYFLLRGRAACCGKAISFRYPLIELLAALILGSLYLKEGWSSSFAFEAALMIVLMILGAIDFGYYRLPNVLVGFGAMISLLWMILSPQQSWYQAAGGMAVGLFFSLLMMAAGRVLMGKWTGFGDLKLVCVLGFTFGPGRLIFLYLISLIGSLIYGLAKRRQDEKRIPLGPFLALGTWITIWIGEELVRWTQWALGLR